MIKQIEVKSIIKKAKNNDNKAFDILINTYWKDIYAFILSKTNNKERAIEITNLTFIKVFEKFSTYKEELNFKNWAITIAYNTFKDQQKKGKNFFVIVDNTLIDNKPTQLEILIKEEEAKFLKKIVDQLKAGFREVIIKHYYEEMTFSEIAVELDISEGNVRTTLHRARKELYNSYTQN